MMNPLLLLSSPCQGISGWQCLQVYAVPAIPIILVAAAAIIWLRTKNQPDKQGSQLLVIVLIVATFLAVKSVFFDGL